MSLWGVGFEVSYAQATPNVGDSSLPVAYRSRCRHLSSSPSPMSAVCCHVLPAMMIMDETSENISQLQLNVFHYKSCCVMVSLQSNRAITKILSNNYKLTDCL